MIQEPAPQPSVVLVGTDAAFLKAVEGAVGSFDQADFTVLAESIEQAAHRPELEAAIAVVVDLDTKRRESLIALQGVAPRSLCSPMGSTTRSCAGSCRSGSPISCENRSSRKRSCAPAFGP